jgi:hypothetical protein
MFFIKKIEGQPGHQRIEDAIQGVEDELQDEKGDPQRQDHQDSRKNL